MGKTNTLPQQSQSPKTPTKKIISVTRLTHVYTHQQLRETKWYHSFLVDFLVSLPHPHPSPHRESIVFWQIEQASVLTLVIFFVCKNVPLLLATKKGDQMSQLGPSVLQYAE